jgi:plasmid stabilization system protein ParE
MSSGLILLPEAKVDLKEAFNWYEDKSLGLGFEFLRCAEAALMSIDRTPLLYPVVFDDYRRALLRRFPFAIFFELDNKNRRVIYSIFHCSQHPDRWMRRL